MVRRLIPVVCLGAVSLVAAPAAWAQADVIGSPQPSDSGGPPAAAAPGSLKVSLACLSDDQVADLEAAFSESEGMVLFDRADLNPICEPITGREVAHPSEEGGALTPCDAGVSPFADAGVSPFADAGVSPFIPSDAGVSPFDRNCYLIGLVTLDPATSAERVGIINPDSMHPGCR